MEKVEVQTPKSFTISESLKKIEFGDEMPDTLYNLITFSAENPKNFILAKYMTRIVEFEESEETRSYNIFESKNLKQIKFLKKY